VGLQAGTEWSLATWNVNSIAAHEQQVLRWLETHRPTVLAMQETQCSASRFPVVGFAALGYQVVVNGDGGTNGVAIASSIPLHDVIFGVPGATGPFAEPRLIGASVALGPAPVRILCAYAPNGRKVGTDAHRFKTSWFELLRVVIEHLDEQSVVVAGDLNIASTDRDVWDPARYRARNLTSPQERAVFNKLLDGGLIDVVRQRFGDAQLSTWWNRRGDFFETDRGWRLDHVLATADVAATVESVRIDRSERTSPGTSDHVPLLVRFGRSTNGDPTGAKTP
jgi:exodeoxyribonuclease III